MTDETRPFARTRHSEDVGLVLDVGRSSFYALPKEYAHEASIRINAAHESRCQARERRAAVKALREAADSEALKDDFGHGEVITKHDVRTALRAEAAAIERGEVSP